MKRQQNPLSTLAIYAVSAGLAAVGIAGFVRGRKILKGTGPEIKKVQIKEGAVQSPDDQTMRSGWPKGNQYTSFFTPGVEASLEGQFMAWRNNNQIQVCDLITGYIPESPEESTCLRPLRRLSMRSTASTRRAHPGTRTTSSRSSRPNRPRPPSACGDGGSGTGPWLSPTSSCAASPL